MTTAKQLLNKYEGFFKPGKKDAAKAGSSEGGKIHTHLMKLKFKLEEEQNGILTYVYRDDKNYLKLVVMVLAPLVTQDIKKYYDKQGWYWTLYVVDGYEIKGKLHYYKNLNNVESVHFRDVAKDKNASALKQALRNWMPTN